MAEGVVVDASAIVDLLLGRPAAAGVETRLAAARSVEAPGHLDAEVLSALGRLGRAGVMGDEHVEAALNRMAAAPIGRHPVAGLLVDAWSLRHELRLVDALYVALAARLDVALLTTDRRLASTVERAELIGP